MDQLDAMLEQLKDMDSNAMLDWLKTKGPPVLSAPTDPSVRGKAATGGPPRGPPAAPSGRGRGNPRGGAAGRAARPVRPAGPPKPRPVVAPEAPKGPPKMSLAEEL